MMNKQFLMIISTIFLLSSCSAVIEQPQIGPQGPIGPRGEPGLNGINGIQGIPGPTGPAGPEGPRGFSGSSGSRGPAGAAGAAGASSSGYVKYPGIATVSDDYLTSVLVNDHDYFVISDIESYLEFATFTGSDGEDLNEILNFYLGKFILTNNINLDWDYLEANHNQLLVDYGVESSVDLMIGKKANDSFSALTDGSGNPYIVQFGGLFDGAGKTISGLTISSIESDLDFTASLFYTPSTLIGGLDFEEPSSNLNITVKNLNIFDFGFIVDSSSEVLLTAGLFSYVNASRLVLSNITVSNSIFSNEDTEDGYKYRSSSAGLVGLAYVKNLIVDNVKLVDNEINSVLTAGGLLGSVNATNSVSVTNSSADFENTVISKSGNSGGLIGSVFTRNLLVKNSNNQGSVLSCIDFNDDYPFNSCSSSEESFSGGIIGLLVSNGNASFDNVYNSGVVIGYYASGGIVGIAVSSSIGLFFNSFDEVNTSLESEIKMTNTYSAGAIIASAYVGGIIGYIYIGEEFYLDSFDFFDEEELFFIIVISQLFKTFVAIDNSYVSSLLISIEETEVGGFIGGFGSPGDSEPSSPDDSDPDGVTFTNIEFKINNSFLYTTIDGSYTESNPILGSSVSNFIGLNVKPANVFFNYSEDAQFDDLFGSLPIFEDKYFKKNDFIFKNNWDFTNTWKFDNSLNGGLPTLINNPHVNNQFVLTPP